MDLAAIDEHTLCRDCPCHIKWPTRASRFDMGHWCERIGGPFVPRSCEEFTSMEDSVPLDWLDDPIDANCGIEEVAAHFG